MELRQKASHRAFDLLGLPLYNTRYGLVWFIKQQKLPTDCRRRSLLILLGQTSPYLDLYYVKTT